MLIYYHASHRLKKPSLMLSNVAPKMNRNSLICRPSIYLLAISTLLMCIVVIRCIPYSTSADKSFAQLECKHPTFVDRVDNGWVVLVDRTGFEQHSPQALFPSDVVEGHVWIGDKQSTQCTIALSNRIKRILNKVLSTHPAAGTIEIMYDDPSKGVSGNR